MMHTRVGSDNSLLKGFTTLKDNTEKGEQAAFLLCLICRQELEQIKSSLKPATQLRQNFPCVSQGLKQCWSLRAVLCLLFVAKGRSPLGEFSCFVQDMSCL